MRHVFVVTLNPAIDITYELPALQVEGVNRIRTVRRMAGGKGINVLRVLRQLGVSSTGVGFLGGASGRWISEELDREQIPFRPVAVEGETRSTIAVIDKSGRGATELIEPGPVVGGSAPGQLLQLLQKQVMPGDYVVVSGSQPQGIEPAYTAQIIDALKQAGCLTGVDVSGQILTQALKSCPGFVKVNEEEFKTSLGLPTNADWRDLVSAARGLIYKGTTAIVITRAATGSIVVTLNDAWKVSSPVVPVQNAVGSGDAFFAGMLSQLVVNKSWSESAALGAICGASNATFATAGRIDTAHIAQLRAQVSVTTCAPT